jgi:hypothetical protein
VHRRLVFAFVALCLCLTASGCSAAAPAPSSGGAASPGKPEAAVPTGGQAASGQGATATQPVAPAAAPSKEAASATATATPANPLSVKPVADGAKGAKALIPIGGGSLKTTSAEGVVYSLTLPKDALLSDEEISLTPVSKVDGLPLSGGLLGGVQIEPDGLRLAKPATLTIDIPSGFKAADLVGFAYHGSGAEFHLYPVAVKGSTVTAQLTHFSGYGGGQGTQADTDTQQQQRKPSAAEDQAMQDAAKAIEDARRAGKDIPVDAIEKAMRSWFYGSIQANLKAGETDDKVFDAAVCEYLSWSRQVELIGIGERFVKERSIAARSITIGLKNAFDKAYKGCTKDRDPDKAVEMLRRSREATILDGLDGISGKGLSLEEIMPQLKECLTFRLDYESIVKWEMDTNLDMTSHVKSQVTLKMNDDFRFSGKGTLEYVDYAVEFRGESAPINNFCKITVQKTNSNLRVVDGTISINMKANPEAKMVLALAPGVPTERMDWKCDTGGGFFNMPVPFDLPMWSAGFSKVNEPRKVSSFGADQVDAYIYSEFKGGGKPLVARLTGEESTTVEGSKVTETRTMDVIHTPGE